jgi:hypothetical protein
MDKRTDTTSRMPISFLLQCAYRVMTNRFAARVSGQWWLSCVRRGRRALFGQAQATACEKSCFARAKSLECK